MILSGLTDEAGDDLESQIRATREIGWSHIDLRKVDGKFLWEQPLEVVRAMRDRLDEAGIKVAAVASAIANGQKDIDKPFDPDVEEARELVRRMEILGTRLVRVMSYPPRNNDCFDPDQRENERFLRLREIVRIFVDAGLQALHENCHNYGGFGPSYTKRLIDEVPGLRLIFDPGNSTGSPDVAAGQPVQFQSAWQFFKAVQPWVDEVHIKDRKQIQQKDGSLQWEHTFPGEGAGDVVRLLGELVENGFPGVVAIEPHLGGVPRPGLSKSEARFSTYVEYGRRLNTLIDAARSKTAGR